jgi:hypothetical protein
LSNRVIAGLQGTTIDAVKTHAQSAIAKLQLESRAALRSWTGVPKHGALRHSLEQRSSAMKLPLKIGAIGQISRAVKDIEQAQQWYGGTLGLTHLYTFGKLAFFDCGGTRLYLQEQPEVGPESILYLMSQVRGAPDTEAN